MSGHNFWNHAITRREAIQTGMRAAGAGMLGVIASRHPFAKAAEALAASGKSRGRILVVLELSGGNDGLNTLVPYGDDAYYRQRPEIGLKAGTLRKIDGHFGFNSPMAGFERLYKDGQMAIVHGCGYADPSFSHFTSMAYWHTAAPNSGEEYGWIGRTADALQPGRTPNFIVNIDSTQSLAVRSRNHTPVVFDDPARFSREGFFQQMPHFDQISDDPSPDNPSRRFLLEVARSAREASLLIREAWANYRTPVDYGIVPIDLPKIASLIAADMPTRLYYTSFRNNAFDTHVYQQNLHARLLTYASDAVSGFMSDMERIGRADDVVMMIFSEFGRRVPENTSLGTDHGAANLMFVVGKPVRGGHYGQLPSLTELDDGDNLAFTTDFRRVYATMIEDWLGYRQSSDILHGEFETFPMFV